MFPLWLAICLIVLFVYSLFKIKNFLLSRDSYREKPQNKKPDYAKNPRLKVQRDALIVKINQELSKLPDKYINLTDDKKVLDPLKKYADKIVSEFCEEGYTLKKCLQRHNENFIKRHISDAVFDDIDGRSLSEEQRRAVLCDARSSLVLAGAGSGKTFTICGKVKYLLEKNFAKENEILLLSYSHDSAKDLEKKVSKIAQGLTVKTFHSLGYQILTETFGEKKSTEDQFSKYIKKYFDEVLVKNSRQAGKLIDYLANYFDLPEIDKRNIANKKNGLRSKNFATMKNALQELTLEPDKKMTMQREYVKSAEELVIANFLSFNGIKYEYERPYEIPTATIEKRQYLPDFYLPDYGIYIEHYGINKAGETPQYQSAVGKKYLEGIEWKRKIHAENSTVCIETYSYEFEDETLCENLERNLKAIGVKFHPLSDKEIFNILHSVYEGRSFLKFQKVLCTFLALYKSNYRANENGFRILSQQYKFKTARARKRMQIFLEMAEKIYRYYVSNLEKSGKIDFDDMILRASECLDGLQSFRYKYIIVDEFQDISQSRNKLLRKLIKHGDSKLFAVGDDWQAIYRFAGSDVGIIQDFGRIFEDSETNFISTTYRNSAELQQVAEKFITQNPLQVRKNIHSEKHQENPIRIVYHDKNRADALMAALKDIASMNKDAKIMLLGRNRRDIDALQNHDRIIIINDKNMKDGKGKSEKLVKHIDFPDMEMKYYTVHSSKGLEEDYVILLNGDDDYNGFPNKMEEDPIVSMLLKNNDNYPFAEERRLFYVAITRTKLITYILADRNAPSEFVSEIEPECLIM